jgi:ABC-2 type transport system ATP-binding protein
LNTADLAVEADLRMDEISYGQRRRLGLALALVDDPRILLLDDPTAGLNWSERRGFWQVVRRIRDAGTTLIVATRHADEAEELCDRVAVMDRGRVFICDTPHALVSSLNAEAVVSFSVEGQETPASLEPDLDLLRGVLSCDHEGAEIQVRTNDATATVAGLDVLASTRGVSFTELSVRSLDLGDVFVAYAGRRLG